MALRKPKPVHGIVRPPKGGPKIMAPGKPKLTGKQRAYIQTMPKNARRMYSRKG